MSVASCGFEKRGADGRRLLMHHGPTLAVDVGFDPDYQVETPSRVPAPGMRYVQALIDTGASLSCIDLNLALSLDLPIIDSTPIAGVGGLHRLNKHIAQIHAPDLKFTLYGGFIGVNLAVGGTGYQVLIGRDFLSHFTLTYDGPTGAVTLSDGVDTPQSEPWTDE